MEFSNLNYTLNRVAKQIENNLKNSVPIASGRLKNSIRCFTEGNDRDLSVKLRAEDYLLYVDKGRSAGKMPPLEPLKEWCSVKGIPESAAYPIALKIRDLGIPATNVIENSVSSVRGLELIQRAASKDIQNEIVNDLKETLNG